MKGKKISSMIIQAHGLEPVSRQQSRERGSQTETSGLTELRRQRPALEEVKGGRICWQHKGNEEETYTERAL